MCVIVHQDSSANISKDFARELWKINPDGGGFAYLVGEEIRVQKHMDFPTFWSSFETARSTHPNRDFMLHMRIATHGGIDIKNVHPFQLDEWTIMAHNGIIHDIADELDLDEKDDRTDTEVFILEVLSLLPRGWLDNRHIRKMVEEYVGWSRLMFLTTDPTLKHTVYKLGSGWDWDQGVHLSNDNHLEVNETQMTGWEAVNMGSHAETSQEWDAWRQYKEGQQARTVYGENWEPEWELEQLLDALKAERNTMYISHPLILIGDDPLQIECSGCLEEVDVDTAECSCWDMACLNCNRFIAYCAMGADCGIEAMVQVDNLNKEDQDELMGLSGKESEHAKVLAAELAEPW